jgi:hypothetical protein
MYDIYRVDDSVVDVTWCCWCVGAWTSDFYSRREVSAIVWGCSSDGRALA